MRVNLPFSMIECVKDKNGRYDIVRGVLQDTLTSILNVYYPPAHSSDFVTKIHSDIAIVGGDFNQDFILL